MKAAEFTEGLKRLGVIHSPTIPHSPYQNGKQEVLWSRLEGRLIAMLEKHKDLTLKKLNDFTQLWAYGSTGLKWKTSRLAWDSLRITEITGTSILGEFWDVPNQATASFRVDLADGTHEGGVQEL